MAHSFKNKNKNGWLVWKNKILAWDNMYKRGFYCPSRCYLCLGSIENVLHLFV